jgi:ketosteroid isomerase-like protein
MSASDVEAMQRLYEAFNRGDYEASREMLHPDAVLHQWSDVPDSDTYVGRDEFVRGLGRWLSGFEPGFQFAAEEISDGGHRVVSRITLRGRGRGSGLELEQTVFQVWEVRDGHPSQCWVFSTEAEAWEAVGASR